MSLEDELGELFTDTVTLETFVSTNGAGARTYAQPPKSIKARVEQFARKVTDAQGREVVSNTRVWLTPTDTGGAAVVPTPKDRLTLPAGHTPQQPPIISVQRENDETGLHHWVVNL